jgi:hypothetical protein
MFTVTVTSIPFLAVIRQSKQSFHPSRRGKAFVQGLGLQGKKLFWRYSTQNYHLFLRRVRPATSFRRVKTVPLETFKRTGFAKSLILVFLVRVLRVTLGDLSPKCQMALPSLVAPSITVISPVFGFNDLPFACNIAFALA